MKPFDFLLFIFVLFPLFTGGFWIDSPGLHLEFNEITPGVALIGLLTLWNRWKLGSHAFFSESRTARILQSWRPFLEKKNENVFLMHGFTFLAVSLLWSLAALRKHWSFNSGAADLGIFTNVLWNIIHTGMPYSSLKGGINFFSDHPMLTLLPISWLYQFFPRPEFLLMFQSFSLASAGIALALLVRQRGIRGPLLWICPFLIWAYSPVRAANLYDFHPESLMLPLFLFGIYFLQEIKFSRRLFGLGMLILGALSKESGGPLLFAIALSWILGCGPFRTRKFTRYLGLLCACFALFLFWFQTKFLPEKLGSPYAYGSLYEPFGTSLFSLLLAPFRFPYEFAQRMLGFARIKFLFFLGAPLLFLPFSSWKGLVVCAIPFTLLFLAAGDQRLSLGFHYGIEPAVALFFVFSFSLGRWKIFVERKWNKSLTLLLVFASALFFKKSEMVQIRRFQSTGFSQALSNQILPNIPPDVSVSASAALVPHLANRKWVQVFPEVVTADGNLVDCVLWETSLRNAGIASELEIKIKEKLERNYHLLVKQNSLSIFELNKPSHVCYLKPNH